MQAFPLLLQQGPEQPHPPPHPAQPPTPLLQPDPLIHCAQEIPNKFLLLI